MSTIEPPAQALPGFERPVQLGLLFRGVWKLRPTTAVVDGPLGTRMITELLDARIAGRVTGHLIGNANADWVLVNGSGIATLDWRATFETEDGAALYLHGGGRVDASAGFFGALIVGDAQFETSDERYRWLNTIHALYRGVAIDDGDGGTYHDEYYEVR
jgi:hypothetical protein